MKNLAFLVIIGLFIACSTAQRNLNSINFEEVNSNYRIKKIEDEKSFYIIYAVRNDSTFKIISNVIDINPLDCENIQVGKAYFLDLKVIFPSDSLLGKPFAPNLGIKGYSLNNEKKIMLEKKSHNKIYTALNISGLCIKYLRDLN